MGAAGLSNYLGKVDIVSVDRRKPCVEALWGLSPQLSHFIRFESPLHDIRDRPAFTRR